MLGNGHLNGHRNRYNIGGIFFEKNGSHSGGSNGPQFLNSSRPQCDFACSLALHFLKSLIKLFDRENVRNLSEVKVCMWMCHKCKCKVIFRRQKRKEGFSQRKDGGLPCL